jgi:hypothetical protein
MARPTTPPRLLAGPYTPPPVRHGDRTTCLYRDADVVIICWSNTPIPWPRCRLSGTHGGGSGLLVTEELARAVRTESAAAVCYWWGVTAGAVWRWRKALGVNQWGTQGSRLLHQAASEQGADAIRGKCQSEETVRRRMRTRRERGCPPPTGRWAEDGWKPEEVALLGTMPDNEVAEQLGRTKNAVRLKRSRLEIPNPTDQRRTWTAAEDKAVRTLTPGEAAAATGRTLAAVYARRFVLARTGDKAGERPTA